MNRRDLLRLMLASAAAEAVDFEKLLWVPKPIITVPGLQYSGIIHLDLCLTDISVAYARASEQLGYFADRSFPLKTITVSGHWEPSR